MRSRIVQIGDFHGVRIPKPLLEQAGLQNKVEIVVEGDRAGLHPVNRPREGWAEAFSTMTERGDDALLDGDALCLTSWDEVES